MGRPFILHFNGLPLDIKNLRYTFQFLQHVIDDNAETPIGNIMQVIYPDQENVIYKEMKTTLTPLTPKINGKVIFLTNAAAISAAEHFLGVVKHYKLGEIIGEPTAGVNGVVNWIHLHGGLSLRWTGMKILKQDGSQFHLVGVNPTVPVTRTIEGIKLDRDEYLEKALELLKDYSSN